MSQLSTCENPIRIPDNDEIQFHEATQELTPKEGATVMNRPEYFLS